LSQFPGAAQRHMLLIEPLSICIQAHCGISETSQHATITWQRD
jgi:hypothetical protein